MKKLIIASIIASSSALAGCQAVQAQAATMILGEQFVQANEGIDRCDLSGLPYLQKAATDNSNQVLQSAALLSLGSHYAAIGKLGAVDTIAQKIASISTSTTFAQERKALIKAGDKTANNRVSNGFSRSCK